MTKALIDTDSSGYAFINQVYTQSLNLTSIPLNTPHALHVFNGCESASDLITHYVLLNLLISNYVSHNTLCYVTQLHTVTVVVPGLIGLGRQSRAALGNHVQRYWLGAPLNIK